jgi:hypothetical protein
MWRSQVESLTRWFSCLFPAQKMSCSVICVFLSLLHASVGQIQSMQQAHISVRTRVIDTRRFQTVSSVRFRRFKGVPDSNQAIFMMPQSNLLRYTLNPSCQAAVNNNTNALCTTIMHRRSRFSPYQARYDAFCSMRVQNSASCTFLRAPGGGYLWPAIVSSAPATCARCFATTSTFSVAASNALLLAIQSLSLAAQQSTLLASALICNRRSHDFLTCAFFQCVHWLHAECHLHSTLVCDSILAQYIGLQSSFHRKRCTAHFASL